MGASGVIHFIDMVNQNERAQDTIQRLEAENARLRAALERIVNEPYPSTRAGRSRILRQAKEALESCPR